MALTSLRDFEGRWDVRRQIVDTAGSGARFEGRAEFAPEGDGLAYFERGTLSLEGAGTFAAERRYHWRAENGRILVTFEDGRPFHHFSLGEAAAAEHLCGRDTYRVRYDFTAWPRWQAEWVVSGPRKAYRLTSHYTRPT